LRYPKGNIPWNKGIPASREAVEKGRAKTLGKHFSPRTEFKKGSVPPNKIDLYEILTMDRFREEYVRLGKSSRQVAQEYHTTQRVLLRLLHEYGMSPHPACFPKGKAATPRMLDGLRTMWENPELNRQFRLGRVYPKKDTSIERAMQDELTRRDIPFVKHLPILNRCQADVAFPDQKLAVFCDGDYWHNRPDIRSKDITQEMVLRANGWRVLRFWEHEINASPAACADRVLKELSA
jgi:DNA mismatch endonuclease (patch repair protein)